VVIADIGIPQTVVESLAGRYVELVTPEQLRLVMQPRPVDSHKGDYGRVTVVAGSTMFPRDRVIHSLEKYKIAFLETDSTEELRSKLAGFYAKRTLTQRPILPEDCAHAIVWLAGDQSAKTTGHIIPVDGGLQDAFLR